MVMLDINEIKKDLYKSKNMAKFSHYQSGNLFYEIEFLGGKYQFPIATNEKINLTEITNSLYTNVEGNLQYIDNLLTIKEGVEILDIDKKDDFEHLQVSRLSEDLGITPFGAEVKGSELIRWIQKAMKNEQLIKVG
jgi:hypothetical protein